MGFQFSHLTVMLGSSESAKNGMMDEMDAVATESMCQVGAISYRAGFAVKLREIQGQGMATDAGGDDPQDCELSPVPASAGQMSHEEGGKKRVYVQKMNLLSRKRKNRRTRRMKPPNQKTRNKPPNQSLRLVQRTKRMTKRRRKPRKQRRAKRKRMARTSD